MGSRQEYSHSVAYVTLLLWFSGAKGNVKAHYVSCVSHCGASKSVQGLRDDWLVSTILWKGSSDSTQVLWYCSLLLSPFAVLISLIELALKDVHRCMYAQPSFCFARALCFQNESLTCPYRKLAASACLLESAV